jgi:hypothetical protein
MLRLQALTLSKAEDPERIADAILDNLRQDYSMIRGLMQLLELRQLAASLESRAQRV